MDGMANPALLVMDVQNGIVARYGAQAEPVLTAIGEALAAARAVGVPVVYVRVAFRAGEPEISARNRTFSVLAGSGAMQVDDDSTQVHEAVAPVPGDVVVVKKRVSAFTGSDLEVVLRGLDVQHLVLTGIAT